MSAVFLLDTNICIYIHRQRPPQLLARFARLKVGEAAVSVITYGELLCGAQKSQWRAKAMKVLDEFIAAVPALALPVQAASVYGAIRAALEARGEIIGGNDLWIAAHAKAADLTLVTNNEREFRRVPGLKIQNWAA
ncbi:MAG: type II toxin-antitoxin system VapC family toxin [Xanthobacteraceae bacterium]|nr:type II toxin-antitoxin system VapC family toxin [Xanthobacteraceae bacterium]MBV9627677.1 type II toxin-antitoxin system VapC family toxin [Xanthobacteraceae bacterium]